MSKNIFFMSFLYVFIACSLFLSSIVHSASIKEDMIARIPAINALKDQGIVGENNKGFLEFRSTDKQQQELVNAENRDRSAVYEAIGKSEGAAASLVGERRAKQIAASAASGHWLQQPDGTWFKK
jgi:hypothetical protein